MPQHFYSETERMAQDKKRSSMARAGKGVKIAQRDRKPAVKRAASPKPAGAKGRASSVRAAAAKRQVPPKGGTRKASAERKAVRSAAAVKALAGMKTAGSAAKSKAIKHKSAATDRRPVETRPYAAQKKPAVVPVTPRPAAPAAARSMPAATMKAPSQKMAPPATPRDIAVRTSEARQQLKVTNKPVNQRHGFKTNEWIVYPAHGVGRIVGIEEQEIAGIALELFVITFEKDKMTLRVPTGKLQSVGMRKLAEEPTVRRAMETLKGRARVKRTMWSRRAQEYEAKINSGDLISIAEVVRDLYRSEAQPEQSYSERQLYEAALDRMAREIAAVEKLDERGAVQRITEVLSKSARGRRMAEESAMLEAAAEAAP